MSSSDTLRDFQDRFMHDIEDLKWLIEQNYTAYLTWIAAWLACMLGIVDILIRIGSSPVNTFSLYPLSSTGFAGLSMRY